MLSKEPTISVIVLTCNGLDFLKGCLNSLLESDFEDYEIIVVDNGSSDGSLEWLALRYGSEPRLKVVSMGRNSGFARGNNEGAKQSRGRFLLILNNDTRATSDCLSRIYDIMNSDNMIGAAQCKLLQMDHPQRLESAGHWIDTVGLAHVIGQDEIDRGQHDRVVDIFGATGAAMVVDRQLFEELGGFDEDFFIFFEESDLCWRIWLRGYRVVFIPQATVFHKGGGYVRRADASWRVYLFTRNRMASMIKNYSLTRLVLYLPLNGIVMFGFSLLFGIKGGGSLAWAVMRGLYWNLAHCSQTLGKRRFVQSVRRISDKELVRRGVIRRFRFSVSAREGLYKSSVPQRESDRYLA